MKAMILAAGLGTRLKPFTDTAPKALFEVEGRTLLEWSIRYLKKYGIRDIVINVHHFPEQILSFLEVNKGFGMNYEISDERDLLMNTGGALVKAKDKLSGNGPFLVMGIDVITGLDLKKMMGYHHQKRPLVTLAVKDRKTSRSLLFDTEMQLRGWRDNKSGVIKGSKDFDQALGFSTVHIIDPAIFRIMRDKKPFSIMDFYLQIINIERILGFRHDESPWFEFGRTEMKAEIVSNPDFKKLLKNL